MHARVPPPPTSHYMGEHHAEYMLVDDARRRRCVFAPCAFATMASLLLVAIALPLAPQSNSPRFGLLQVPARAAWGNCSSTDASSLPWCDVTRGRWERARALVAAMSMREKASLLSNHAAAVPRLGLPEYDFWSEGLHGVARAGTATSFPQVIGVAASFNTSLFEAIGRAVATEARGINNALDGQLYHGLTLWAPK